MVDTILKIGALTLEMVNKCIPYDQLKKYVEDYKNAVEAELQRRDRIEENYSNRVAYLGSKVEEQYELIKQLTEENKILKNGGHLV